MKLIPIYRRRPHTCIRAKCKHTVFNIFNFTYLRERVMKLSLHVSQKLADAVSLLHRLLEPLAFTDYRSNREQLSQRQYARSRPTHALLSPAPPNILHRFDFALEATSSSVWGNTCIWQKKETVVLSTTKLVLDSLHAGIMHTLGLQLYAHTRPTIIRTH